MNLIRSHILGKYPVGSTLGLRPQRCPLDHRSYIASWDRGFLGNAGLTLLVHTEFTVPSYAKYCANRHSPYRTTSEAKIDVRNRDILTRAQKHAYSQHNLSAWVSRCVSCGCLPRTTRRGNTDREGSQDKRIAYYFLPSK